MIKFISDLYFGKIEKSNIFGCGNCNKSPEKQEKTINIAINRAICFGNFDILFVDNNKSFNDTKKYHKNTKYIFVPLFSCGKNNLDLNSEKTYFYVWAYVSNSVLNTTYSLNNDMLYIRWGNLNSAIHFCCKEGIKKINTFGCSGKKEQGKLYDNRIKKSFPNFKYCEKTRIRQFKEIEKGNQEICKAYNIKINQFVL